MISLGDMTHFATPVSVADKYAMVSVSKYLPEIWLFVGAALL